MAIHVQTADPSGLLTAIVKEIRDGKIRTWELGNANYVSITHLANQWKRMAYFLLEPKAGYLEMGLKVDEHAVPEGDRTEVYAEYHGHAARLLIAHFLDSMDGFTYVKPPP